MKMTNSLFWLCSPSDALLYKGHCIYICLFVSLSAGHVHICMHKPWGPCGGQRATWRRQLSPSTMWVLRVELKSSDPLIHLNIFLALIVIFGPLQESASLYKGSVLKRVYTILGEFLKSDSQVSSLRHEFISRDVVGVASSKVAQRHLGDSILQPRLTVDTVKFRNHGGGGRKSTFLGPQPPQVNMYSILVSNYF